MAIVVFTFLTAPLLSHHTMAVYDQTTLISIKGVVSKIEWRNPHSWITLTVTNADGKTVAQQIEIAGPRDLMERGFDRTALQIGQTVTLDSCMPKNPGLNGQPIGRMLILADGRRFDVSETNWLATAPLR